MSKGNQYYGGFFWVSAISFIVPLFVAGSAFYKLAPTSKPEVQLDASGVDPKVWDYLLKSYVSNGLVDYKGMKKEYLFNQFISQLGSAFPDALETSDEKLALLCNAYNAFVIDAVNSHKIKDNVMNYSAADGTGFFDIKEHIFAGKTISLNELEKEMIIPVFKEPRVHVVLVCGAISCPGIRGEAYTGERLQEQLEDQSRLFANSKKYVEYKPESNELYLSAILGWYGGDFDEKYPDGGYLQWIKESLDEKKPGDDTIDCKAIAQKAIDGGVKVKFSEYDWALNTQADVDADAAKTKGGGFGSGSIPDE